MVSQALLILAGKTAYDHIRKNGLSQSDIRLVLGASGAAKWLVLYGLDSAIFCDWFKDRTEPLHLLGTSIGAWKFAAAAQKDSRSAFDRLRDAYIHQVYEGAITPEKVSRESDRIMQVFMRKDGIEEILSHPFLRISFSAVRCKNVMASRLRLFQALGMWSGFELNILSRRLQQLCFDRTLFHHPAFDPNLVEMNDFPTRRVPLSPDNFMKALLATASIPVIMEGVADIPGAPKGMYRDGGLLDYHPAFPLEKERDGLVLYPHFYSHIIPGWFDKKFPKRRAKGAETDRVVLLAPSGEFVSGLPLGRIPDRQDFIRLKGKDADRIRAWKTAADKSRILGDIFLEAVETGRIKEMVRLLD